MPTAVSATQTSQAETDEFLARTEGFLKTLKLLSPVDDKPREAVPSGKTIQGRYKIMGQLGEGGGGAVYRVYDRVNRVTRALKVAGSLSYQNPSGLLHFKQEFLNMTALRHPNLPEVHDYGVTEKGEPFLVMEYVPGGVLQTDRPYALEQFYNMIVQMLRALSFIHARGFLHRDVKPQNMIVIEAEEQGGNDRISLLDFGIMERIGATTGQSSPEGTPLYMAPEVITCKPLDPRTDIYSLGLVAFRLLTGKLPIFDRDIEKLLALHQSGERPRVSAHRKDVPTVLDDLIFRMMSASPSDRPANAEDVLYELRTLTDAVLGSDLEARRAYLNASELISREHQVAAMKAGLETAKAENGSGGTYLVSGITGAGKTRLLREIQFDALMTGFAVSGVAVREHHRNPYQALRTILRGLIPFSESADVATGATHALLSLLPGEEVGFDEDSATPEFSAQDERGLIIEETAEWIRRISHQRPVLLIGDDLQWSDESSLLVLQALSQELADFPVVFVSAFRSNEVADNSDLGQWKLKDDVEVVDVPGFDPGEIGDFVDSLLGKHRLSADFVRRVHTATGGNPFFTIELLGDLIRQDKLIRRRSVWQLTEENFALPETLTAILKQRVDDAGPLGQKLVRQLAVAGGSLYIESLLALLDENEAAVLTEVDEIIRLQIAEAKGDAIALVHDTVREFAYESTNAQERKTLHQRLAEFLEEKLSNDETNRLALLGHHYARGVDRAKGLRYLEEAGTRAFEREQHEVAGDLLSESLELLEDLPETPNRDERRYEIRKMLAIVCVSDDYEKGSMHAEWACDEAVRHGVLRPMPVLQKFLPDPIPFIIVLAVFFPARMIYRGRNALRELESDIMDICRITAYGCNSLASMSKLTTAGRRAERLLAFAITRNSFQRAVALVAQTISKYHQEGPTFTEEYDTALHLIRYSRGAQAMDHYSRTLMEGVCLYSRIMCDAWQQSPRFKESHRASEAHASEVNSHFLHHLNSQAYLEYGVFRGNARIADECEAAFWRSVQMLGGKARQREWLVDFAMGQLEIHHGRLARAERRMKRLLRQGPGYFTEGYGSFLCAALNLQWGRCDRALEHSETALGWARDPEVLAVLFEFRVLALQVDIYLAQRRPENAADALAAMKPFAKHKNHPTSYFVNETRRREAMIFALQGSDESLAVADETFASAMELDCPRQVAECHVTVAQVIELGNGSREEIVENLDRAKEIYSSLDNEHRAGIVRGYLTKLSQDGSSPDSGTTEGQRALWWTDGPREE